MSTSERDRQASDLQAGGLTWEEVAKRIGVANGGVARRCAMRHRANANPTDDPTPVNPTVEDDDTPSVNERVSRTEIRINGRLVTTNTELSVRGETGVFTFRYSDRDDEVTVWGGQPHYEKWRTFKIDQVRTVHRKARLRKNAEATSDDKEEVMA